MRHLKACQSALLLLALSGTGSMTLAQAPPPTALTVPAPDTVKGILPRTIQGHMSFLASDLMRGRDTATPEIRLAAEYLATRLVAAGAEPMGDLVDGKRTFFQSYPLEQIMLPIETTELAIKVPGQNTEVKPRFNDEFVIWPIFNVTPGKFSGPVVFAGYGLVDADAKYDDYAGLDVNGKFVLVHDGAPGGDVKIARTDIEFKREQAQNHGAIGLLVVHAAGVTADPYTKTLSFAKRMAGRPQLRTPQPKASTKRIPVVYLEDNIRDRLLPAPAAGTARKNGALEGVETSFNFPLAIETINDRNVVGIFPGADPEKSKEIVIYSAHYDHVGTDAEGKIFNGSDDNASGTSSLLEIAEAYGESVRPSRSVAFLWVSGEEHGLWGSKYFSDHPSIPEGSSIVADLNLDMVSRNDGTEIGMTPSPKHPDFSTMIPQAQEACKLEGLTPLFNADEFYGRTDSYNFAAKGIPVIFFFSGIHADYHQPTDDVEKADFDKAARISRTAFRLGWQVAQDAEKPHKIATKEATAEPTK